MFDLLDIAGDGVIHESELLAASVMLDVEPAVLSKLHKQFCGDDGVLCRAELADVIAKLGEEGRPTSPSFAPDAVDRMPLVASGPSTQVERACSKQIMKEPDVLPGEAVMALASYCLQNKVPTGEVRVHFFPFGGVSKTTKLMDDLAAGKWPAVDP